MLVGSLLALVLVWSLHVFCCFTNVSPSSFGFNIDHVEGFAHSRSRKATYLEPAPDITHTLVGWGRPLAFSKSRIEMTLWQLRMCHGGRNPSGIRCWQWPRKRFKTTLSRNIRVSATPFRIGAACSPVTYADIAVTCDHR